MTWCTIQYPLSSLSSCTPQSQICHHLLGDVYHYCQLCRTCMSMHLILNKPCKSEQDFDHLGLGWFSQPSSEDYYRCPQLHCSVEYQSVVLHSSLPRFEWMRLSRLRSNQQSPSQYKEKVLTFGWLAPAGRKEHWLAESKPCRRKERQWGR